MERVHRYMKQVEAASKKIKTDQGERAPRVPYTRGNRSENVKHQDTWQTRFHIFRQSSWNMPSTRHDPRNVVVTIRESKKNTAHKNREKTRNKDQGWYYKFHESIGHDTIECTMLWRELENKMQSRQLTDLIKGLRSNHLESITPVEPKITNARKMKSSCCNILTGKS